MQNAFATQAEKIVKCDPGSMSFYDLVEGVTAGQANQPLHRFCSLMRKAGAKGLLREELRIDGELLEERDQAALRCQGHVDAEATRLTFFCSAPGGEDWSDEKVLPSSHLLGYAVVVRLRLPDGTRKCYTLEAVARPPGIYSALPDGSVAATPISHYYLHNTREFETTIGPAGASRTMKLDGSFFAQQNDLTHVCAHACLRMAVNSSPTFSTSKLTNKRINDILGKDFTTHEKTVGHYKPVDHDRPGRGLTGEEIEQVVAHLGGRVISADFHEKPSIEYDYFIYPLMESGCPVMLALQGWDARNGQVVSHVVAVLGHTLNSDRWAPEARFGYGNFPVSTYSSATEWVDHFLISDDNYGAYLTLPSDAIRNFVLPTKNPAMHAMRAVGIVPAGVTLSGYAVERVSSQVARAMVGGLTGALTAAGASVPVWLGRFNRNSIVCRTFLQERDEYRKATADTLKSRGAVLSAAQDAQIQAMPSYVWVTEITLPQLYTADKHKLGEVVIRADASEADHRDWKSFAFGWVPGYAVFAGLQTGEPWPIMDHVPLIRRRGTPAGEW